MAEPQKPDSGNNFPESSNNASFSAKEDSFETGGEKNQTNCTGQKDNEKNAYLHPDIIVNVAKENDVRAIAEAQRANRYTRLGLIVNTLLFLGTLGALGFSWWSINKSDSAFTKSFEENKKQFAILNEPILDVSHMVGLSNWKNIDSLSIVTIRMHDFSERAIHVDSCVYGFRYDTANVRDIFNARDTEVHILRTPYYIVPQYYHEDKFDSYIRNSKESIETLKNGINTFFGVVFYRNYLNGKPRYYIFSIRIRPFGPCCAQPVVETYISENQDTLPDYKCKLFPKIAGTKEISD